MIYTISYDKFKKSFKERLPQKLYAFSHIFQELLIRSSSLQNRLVYFSPYDPIINTELEIKPTTLSWLCVILTFNIKYMHCAF